jgi:hypothetical protein
MRIALIGLAAALPRLAACASSGRANDPKRRAARLARRGGGWSGATSPRPSGCSSDRSLDSDDPARLINLGYGLYGAGAARRGADPWRAALGCPPRHRVVETMAGREVRTDQLAATILGTPSAKLRFQQ